MTPATPPPPPRAAFMTAPTQPILRVIRRLPTAAMSTSAPQPPPASPAALAARRVNYSARAALDESALPRDPIAQFAAWYADAAALPDTEPNAMCLATASAAGRPSARMVLLKAFDERGFVWYTNYTSAKARHLAENPFAALTFWWPPLERSVRVEGPVHRVAPEESDAYFASRPAASRLGAWASDQSSVVDSRHTLERRWDGLQRELLDDSGAERKPIERPSHWGGYRLVPDRIEFWKGRSARLHDRIVYEKVENDDGQQEQEWTMCRLQP